MFELGGRRKRVKAEGLLRCVELRKDEERMFIIMILEVKEREKEFTLGKSVLENGYFGRIGTEIE